jgi:hypothetical protein
LAWLALLEELDLVEVIRPIVCNITTGRGSAMPGDIFGTVDEKLVIIHELEFDEFSIVDDINS